MKVDVTITATKRLDILFKTLASFMENLLWKTDCEAIVNVDPVGDDHQSEKVLRVVELFLPVKCSRQGIDPDFCEAFRYTWSCVDAPWVFHLEDDWELKQKVDIDEMRQILEEEDDLALLRLPQFRSTMTDMKNWDKFFPWNGKYFECPDELRQGVGFCGHPSLIKGDYVKTCAELIKPGKNPEKQFHGDNDKLVAEVMKWRYGVFSKPNHPNYIQDLGREWMSKSGWKKEGSKAFFLKWEKEE